MRRQNKYIYREDGSYKKVSRVKFNRTIFSSFSEGSPLEKFTTKCLAAKEKSKEKSKEKKKSLKVVDEKFNFEEEKLEEP